MPKCRSCKSFQTPVVGMQPPCVQWWHHLHRVSLVLISQTRLMKLPSNCSGRNVNPMILAGFNFRWVRADLSAVALNDFEEAVYRMAVEKLGQWWNGASKS
ncbi:hypothetical protein M758_4G178100 [Ceratodon purpureus]|uniref:Uncharacterized protein n=1 Tax=Ceratodon purpureus TaxID=3225 RepID=A0A8T0ID93_CERPU|nr:hypothetical protein KC19_4G176000 [Ceratodon purpureus]KAG0619956.1 hypothetical protein M758_4G178100 [Ceratodon purpureus]